MQRREDAGEKVAIPVPPKYGQGDFAKATYWKARGKLDVPKERFIAYPGVTREGDPTPVLGWAGWSHRDRRLLLPVRFPSSKRSVPTMPPWGRWSRGWWSWNPGWRSGTRRSSRSSELARPRSSQG